MENVKFTWQLWQYMCEHVGLEICGYFTLDVHQHPGIGGADPVGQHGLRLCQDHLRVVGLPLWALGYQQAHKVWHGRGPAPNQLLPEARETAVRHHCEGSQHLLRENNKLNNDPVPANTRRLQYEQCLWVSDRHCEWEWSVAMEQISNVTYQ